MASKDGSTMHCLCRNINDVGNGKPVTWHCIPQDVICHVLLRLTDKVLDHMYPHSTSCHIYNTFCSQQSSNKYRHFADMKPFSQYMTCMEGKNAERGKGKGRERGFHEVQLILCM